MRKVKPDLIIEIGIAHGGSLILSASMLALLSYCESGSTETYSDPNRPKRKVIGSISGEVFMTSGKEGASRRRLPDGRTETGKEIVSFPDVEEKEEDQDDKLAIEKSKEDEPKKEVPKAVAPKAEPKKDEPKKK